jgi:hypothetical protein
MRQQNQVNVKIIASLTLLISVILTLAGAEPLYAADAEWRARYWNNTSLSGDPVLVRNESTLDHEWGDDAPHISVNTDNFSARWTREVDFAAGTYRFTATTDDGMRVWVDGDLIIDVWYDSQVHSVSADRYLSGGDHEIKVEYYEAGGDAVAKLSWALAGGGSGAGWWGEYFNNTSLSGAPTTTRVDGAIDFTWTGAPAPDIDPDRFSVRWTQDVPVQAGTYRFSLTVDDGARLWVNDQLVIDQWRQQPAAAYTADVTVSGGVVPVRLEYFEEGGNATARLSWTRIGGSPTPPPPPPSPTAGDWRGEYYNTVDFSGGPVLVRDDEEINFIWGSSSPAPNIVESDRFSVRWTQTVDFSPGRYVFTVRSDDGARLWVNGQQIIDDWQIGDINTSTGVIDLPGGPTEIMLEYFENTGLAEVHLNWSLPGSDDDTSSSPEQTPIPPGTARMSGASALNVRSGPGLEFESFTHLLNGQEVTPVGRDPFTVWIQIRLPDGGTGWVSGRYLSSATPLSTLPVTGD